MFVQAAVTKCHRMDRWLINSRNELLIVLEAEVPDQRVSFASSGLQTVNFSLYTHMAEEAKHLFGASFIIELISFVRSPTS